MHAPRCEVEGRQHAQSALRENVQEMTLRQCCCCTNQASETPRAAGGTPSGLFRLPHRGITGKARRVQGQSIKCRELKDRVLRAARRAQRERKGEMTLETRTTGRFRDCLLVYTFIASTTDRSWRLARANFFSLAPGPCWPPIAFGKLMGNLGPVKLDVGNRPRIGGTTPSTFFCSSSGFGGWSVGCRAWVERIASCRVIRPRGPGPTGRLGSEAWATTPLRGPRQAGRLPGARRLTPGLGSKLPHASLFAPPAYRRFPCSVPRLQRLWRRRGDGAHPEARAQGTSFSRPAGLSSAGGAQGPARPCFACRGHHARPYQAPHVRAKSRAIANYWPLCGGLGSTASDPERSAERLQGGL